MKLADLQEQLSKMPELTGRNASTYICGLKTYKDMLIGLGLGPSPSVQFAPKPNLRSGAIEPGNEIRDISVMGVYIYPSADAPDEGKFYPADYLESRQCR